MSCARGVMTASIQVGRPALTTLAEIGLDIIREDAKKEGEEDDVTDFALGKDRLDDVSLGDPRRVRAPTDSRTHGGPTDRRAGSDQSPGSYQSTCCDHRACCCR